MTTKSPRSKAQMPSGRALLQRPTEVVLTYIGVVARHSFSKPDAPDPPAPGSMAYARTAVRSQEESSVTQELRVAAVAGKLGQPQQARLWSRVGHRHRRFLGEARSFLRY